MPTSNERKMLGSNEALKELKSPTYIWMSQVHVALRNSNVPDKNETFTNDPVILTHIDIFPPYFPPPVIKSYKIKPTSEQAVL